MSDLHARFLDALSRLGLFEQNGRVKKPVLYGARYALRFEIGGDEDAYLPKGGANPVYLENALCRATTLLDALPCRPDILRIDAYGGADERRALSVIGLPEPDETADAGEFECLYWDLARHGIPEKRLLWEILRGDIDGNGELCSSVYWLSAAEGMLYYLYDDRGADVAACERNALLPMYQTFGRWLCAFDKEMMEERLGHDECAD